MVSGKGRRWAVVGMAAVLLGAIVLLVHLLRGERQEAERKRLAFESSIAWELSAEFFPDYERFCAGGNAEYLRLAADRIRDRLGLYFTYFEQPEELEGWYDEGQWLLPLEQQSGRYEPEIYIWHTMYAYANLVEARALGAPEAEVKACFEAFRPYFDILFRWELLWDTRYENGEFQGTDGVYAGTPGLGVRFRQFQELILEDTGRWHENIDRVSRLLDEVEPVEKTIAYSIYMITSSADLQVNP